MAGYVGNIPVPQATQTRQSFTATASQTSFPTIGYTEGFFDCHLNGVKLLAGVDFNVGGGNGSDVILATGAALNDILEVTIFDTFNTSSGTFSSTTLKNNVTLKNDTHEDSDGGRASKIIYQGEQSGGEISTLAEIQASHDGSADDQKSDLIFRTNDGSDGTSPTEAMRIDSAQNVGIGTSSIPAASDSYLTVGTQNYAISHNGFSKNSYFDGSNYVAVATGVGKLVQMGDDIVFNSAPSVSAGANQTHAEQMRLDSAGRLLIGTTTEGNANADDLTLSGGGKVGMTIRSTDSNESSIYFSDGTSGAPEYTGYVAYAHGDNSLRIGTNATERVRINSNGKFGVGVDPSYYLHVYGDVDLDFVSEIRNTGSNGPYGQVIRFSNAAPDNNVRQFLYFTDNAAVRFMVDSDGDVRNHDNSYGSLSDQRIKESILDASSQWDDIKALRVRKFKFKDDVRQYGDDAKFKLGLVAQEAELVSPNLIQEASATPNNILSSSEFGTLYTKDDDETKDAVLYTSDDEEVKRGDKEVGDIKIPSTKEVGDVKERKTTVKGVRYSILYMKAVKALQEAMARIETLETKVAALEAE